MNIGFKNGLTTKAIRKSLKNSLSSTFSVKKLEAHEELGISKPGAKEGRLKIVQKTLKKELLSLFIILGIVSYTFYAKTSQGQFSLASGQVEDGQVYDYINSLSDISSLALFTGRGGDSIRYATSPQISQESSLIGSTGAVLDTASTGNNETVLYRVQSGDTISNIALDFGVSANTIVWANDLTNQNYLKEGTELKIPPITGVIHRVKSGDTLAKIASIYGVEVGTILNFNRLSDDSVLAIGQEVIVPDGVKKATSTKSVTLARNFGYLPKLIGYFSIPATGFNWGIGHGRGGVDIANSCGTNILAAASGIITAAYPSGWNGGFGEYVKISHPNGTETLYGHLSKVLVRPNQSVSQGELIGLMGTTGRSTGCHLHYEVHGAVNEYIRK